MDLLKQMLIDAQVHSDAATLRRLWMKLLEIASDDSIINLAIDLKELDLNQRSS